MTIYKFAGFWRRFVAYAIDGLIIGIILIILTSIAVIAYFTGAMSGGGARGAIGNIADPELIFLLTMWVWIFSIVLNMAYFTFFHGLTGRTPGKKLLGLQVVTVEGGPLTFGIAFLRSVGYLLSSLFFCLGYLWAAFDKKKQGWHDKIAGTVVIIREPDGPAAGISISDAPAIPREQPFDGNAETPPQAEHRTEGTASAREIAGPGDQKIP